MQLTIKRILSEYIKKLDGSMAIMFAILAPFLVLVVGVSFDTSRLNNSKSQAQLMADIIGLNASIYVKNNDAPPSKSSEGYLNNVWYDAKEQELNFGPGVSGENSTRFKVIYDDVADEARVVVESNIKPLFMGSFGFSEIKFTTLSTVKYAQKDHSNPASIFLVIDNSGSMAFDDIPKTSYWSAPPASAEARLAGLKVELKKFMEQLDSVITPDPDDPSRKFLRMGMTVYNSDIINAKTIRPDWGVISNAQIDAMTADGGTVPTNALAKLQGWMTAEKNQHKRVNGSDDPLRYVVFMADGANNSTQDDEKAQRVCTKLKDDGVEIFTIGYALEPGYFNTGIWGERYNQPVYYISPDVKQKAESFLKSCASSDAHFLLADDTSALKAAFDKIGAEIVEDAVRIAS
jgi:Flp pilus assembly protein TadG